MLHKIKNFSKIILMCLVIVSCEKNKDNQLIKEVIASLNTSNLVIISQTRNTFVTLQNNLEKAETREKTVFFYPKADSIQYATNKLIIYVNSFADKKQTNAYFLRKQELKQLYGRILEYKSRVFEMDKKLKTEIEESLKFTTEDEKELSEAQFISLFKNIPHKIKLAILVNRFLKNNLFCVEWLCKYSSGICGNPYDAFQAISAQNSTHFKANETLEIYAGVGSFSIKAMPLVTVDGQPILLNQDGVAEYKTKVSNKKGKYKKLVKIQFRKPDGTAYSIEKEIIYSVDK